MQPDQLSSLEIYFERLTTFPPRQFQREAIAQLLRHHNTLLRAPTGSGKTETAIAPFLFAKSLNLDFPNKLIYVVPLRTLANSLRDRAQDLVQRWSNQYSLHRPLVVTLQTGENPEDPRFEGDIIFCTIDQLLSSFLNIPYSVGRGSANVNAGMVFASYLVFDELHLLDPQRSFATVLKLLQQVQGISPFLLMTATLTDELAEHLTPILKDQNNFIKVSDEDLTNITGQRQRFFSTQPHPLTAQVIWDDLQNCQRQRVIVICNTVSQAQGLYKDLEELNQDNRLHLILLHSRFLPKDRALKERYLEDNFGRNRQVNGQCHILIATQVIEVGLNITCEVMHTQLCPMNSLLQRAGRCARFPGEQGQVYVYPTIVVNQKNLHLTESDLENEPDKEPSSKRKFLPYNDKLCELTWQVLEAHSQSIPVTFRTEEQWINQVHQDEDLLDAQRRANNQAEFDRQFHEAIFYGEKSAVDMLIRFVDSRSIFVWEERTYIDFDDQPLDPKKLLAFSIPTPTLCNIWRKYRSLEYKTDWLFQRIEYPKDWKSETYNQPTTVTINSYQDLVNSFQIVVNPRYLYYDEQIGLQIGVDIEGNQFSSPEKPQKQISSEYQYHMDNYVGHLVLMWKCWREAFSTKVLVNGQVRDIIYSSVRDELLQAGGKLIQTKIFFHATPTDAETLFEYLVLLAVFTHDLGKLQIKWQKVMSGWQKIAHCKFGGKHPRTHLLAHTDYNPEDKRQWDEYRVYEKQHKRPNHAVESAFLAREMMSQSLFPLLKNHFHASQEQAQYIAYTIILAAGRHHSAWAKGWETKDLSKIGTIQLHPETQQAIAQSWRCLMHFFPNTLPLPTAPSLSKNTYQPRELDLTKLSPTHMTYLQLYSLVVRALRLCDMRSVQR